MSFRAIFTLILLISILVDGLFCIYLIDYDDNDEAKYQNVNEIDASEMVAEIIMDYLINDLAGNETSFGHLQPLVDQLMERLIREFYEIRSGKQLYYKDVKSRKHANHWYWISRQG